MTDMSSTAFRCNELDITVAANTSVATVAAGSTVGFKADNTMGHPGYFSAYMSKASPAANSTSAATGKTWFKARTLNAREAPKWTASTGLIFVSESKCGSGSGSVVSTHWSRIQIFSSSLSPSRRTRQTGSIFSAANRSHCTSRARSKARRHTWHARRSM